MRPKPANDAVTKVGGSDVGRLIKADVRIEAGSDFLQRLRGLAQGPTSWAELEGTSWEEAKAIGQVGCDLAAEGRLEEARIVFDALVEAHPKDSAARAALGTVYQKLGRASDALAEYDAALAADPANPVALANRGELRLRAGDQEGFADLSAALEADPLGETAAARRARSLIKSITALGVESAGSGK